MDRNYFMEDKLHFIACEKNSHKILMLSSKLQIEIILIGPNISVWLVLLKFY